MSPQTDSDQVDGAQRETVFLIRPVISDTQPSLFVISVQAQQRRSQSVWDTNLHLFDETSEVVCRLMCVFHRLKIVHIRSSVVPVHDYEIHVFAGQQELYDIRHPFGWRSCGPVPMNDEGGYSGRVELGVGGQVGVGQESTTSAIFPGVEQQPDLDAGSN